jgi:flagellar motility protein MotE (MotC chaperone)
MKNLILLFSLILLAKSVVAQDKKLQFTEEEFKNAVYDEMMKKMKKIGRSKMIDFSKQLLEKEENLEKREKAIVAREEQVKINEEELKKKIVEFQMTQNKFLVCLDKEDKEIDNRVRHMVDVVAGMRPQTAASLLSQQDPSISVKILGELDSVKVSKIFNLMDKEISARLQKQYMTMKK